MIESKSVGEISLEIGRNLKKNIIEIFTEECNKEVVEYCLVKSELSRFLSYDKYSWNEFNDNECTPRDEGYYWLTVIDNDGERRVVLIKWYNRNSLRYWNSVFKELIAWKICIMPEPYK